MSETQVKVTGSFQAVDEDGNEYPVTEYSIFRKTTTTDMAFGSSEGEEVKEYKLADGKVLNQLSETEFELEDGTKFRRRSSTI
jgi:hypothetical protein